MNDNHPAATPRPLDHCVLPTASLDATRTRLTALGFTVAPQGDHPFGTINSCVYFSNDTFLEPLAIGDGRAVEAAIGEGNVFLSRDHAFRKVHGEEGFSALVVGTKDAADDHARFVEHGVSAGAPLDFSRPVQNSAGQKDEASFRLAFAAQREDAETFFFACERANMPAVDRSALERHQNGVIAIARIVAVANDPASYAKLLAELTLAVSVNDGADGIRFVAANGGVSIMTPIAAQAFLAADIPASDKLALRAIVFRTTDLRGMATLLAANAVDFIEQNGHVIVRPAPGQGAFFVFEEMP